MQWKFFLKFQFSYYRAFNFVLDYPFYLMHDFKCHIFVFSQGVVLIFLPIVSKKKHVRAKFIMRYMSRAKCDGDAIKVCHCRLEQHNFVTRVLNFVKKNSSRQCRCRRSRHRRRRDGCRSLVDRRVGSWCIEFYDFSKGVPKGFLVFSYNARRQRFTFSTLWTPSTLRLSTHPFSSTFYKLICLAALVTTYHKSYFLYFYFTRFFFFYPFMSFVSWPLTHLIYFAEAICALKSF